MRDIAKDMLFGIAVGDALGVPYEFLSREEMAANPAKNMIGYKTHNQPIGTWSDDSSLTFCLAESLIQGYSLESTARNFVEWKNNSYWTARDNVFDIGMTTLKSITKLEDILLNKTIEELDNLKYKAEEHDNGNGSLMRILPLIFEVINKNINLQFDIIWRNSALTHRHIRAAMSCLIYLKFAEYLIKGLNKFDAYQKTKTDIKGFWNEIDFLKNERKHFVRIIDDNIIKIEKKSIFSSGYVIDSLEASFWCFLKTDTYQEAVLEAINLGGDTDTIGTITGGIAGIYYSFDEIPQDWINLIAKKNEIENLSKRLNKKYN